jgi:hypothetical protein
MTGQKTLLFSSEIKEKISNLIIKIFTDNLRYFSSLIYFRPFTFMYSPNMIKLFKILSENRFAISSLPTMKKELKTKFQQLEK